MRINKKISALLCSVAMCCSNGQVSKTSASFLGYFFSVAAVQGWIFTASYYYSKFKSSSATREYYWFVPFCKPGEYYMYERASEGLKNVLGSLSRLENVPGPTLFTYLAHEEFRKEKENDKRASNENMYVDPKNSKDKKYDTNK